MLIKKAMSTSMTHYKALVRCTISLLRGPVSWQSLVAHCYCLLTAHVCKQSPLFTALFRAAFQAQ